MNTDKNYYEILGIALLAEDVVIKAAYKAMAQKYHPDKFQGNAAEASAKMAEINEAYAVLTDVELRRTYDDARKNIQSRDVAVNEALIEEVESCGLAIQQDSSSATSPRIPKLLARSFVVGILLIIAGAVMSGVFSNKGGGAVIGLGLMGLAFFSLPSFVWWGARGGIEDALFGKLLRYSFYAIPLLFILGGFAGAFSKKQADDGVGIISIFIIFALLVFVSVLVAWLARRVYVFISTKKPSISKHDVKRRSAEERNNEQFESDVKSNCGAITDSDSREEVGQYKSTWLFSPSGVVFLDDQAQLRAFHLGDFQRELTEKRGHWFLDKSVSVAFHISGESLVRWLQLSESFDHLKSRQMFVTTDYVKYSRKESKERSGADGYYEEEKVKLGHHGATGVINRNVKEPLTLRSKARRVTFFPTMAIVENGKSIRVLPLRDIKITTKTASLIGDAPWGADVIERRWKYINLSDPNRKAPDSRYKDNRKVDVYRVEWLYIAFEGGQLDFCFSKPGCTENFVSNFERLKKINRS